MPGEITYTPNGPGWPLWVGLALAAVLAIGGAAYVGYRIGWRAHAQGLARALRRELAGRA